MDETLDRRQIGVFHQLASLAASFSGAISAVVLLGWWLGLPPLVSGWMGSVPMNPLTAVAVLAAAFALGYSARGELGSRHLTTVLGLAVAALATLRLVADAGGPDPALDLALFSQRVAAVGVRMAPMTAFALLNVGLALVFANRTSPLARRGGELMACVCGLIGLMALMGYAYDALALARVGNTIPMAVHTAMALSMLAGGVLLSRSEDGLLAPFARRTPGGHTLRTLLPVFIVMPFLMGWARLWGEANGLYHTAFGTALMVSAMIALSLTFIWRHALALDAADRARQEAERALVRQREEQALILNTAGDGIARLDAAGTIRFVNPAAARMLGASPSSLTGKAFSGLVLAPADAEHSPILETLKDGQPRAIDDAAFVRANGASLPVTYVVTPLAAAGGEQGAVVVFQDATAQLAARQALVQAKQASDLASGNKSAFLASMTHELRTPLHAILGHSEMLLDEAEAQGDVALAQDLQSINSAGHHLLGLLNDVLDLSKIEAGKMEVLIEEVDPGALTTDVIATLAPLAEKRGNLLTTEVAPDLPLMQTDATKLRQVLYNLLSNACKFTEGGRVTLEVAAEPPDAPEWVLFHVHDTGPGMTPEQLGRLFQAFMQADASTQKRYGGTGLGLSISQRYCQMLGGTIAVDSAPGEGSTFTARLPVTSAQPIDESTSPPIIWLEGGGLSPDRT